MSATPPPASDTLGRGSGGVPSSAPTSIDDEALTRTLEELEKLEFFHGTLLEDDVSHFLQKHGDFIIRTRSDINTDKEVVLSIFWGTETFNIAMKTVTKGGNLVHSFDDVTKSNNPTDLLKRHMTGTEIKHGAVRIQMLNPVPKSSWELKRDSIVLEKKLGEGAFGEVHAGTLKVRKKRRVRVAIKVIKRSEHNEKAVLELQKEAAMMRQLKHKNIVAFHGMVVERSTTMIVMELVDGGSLDTYFHANPKVPMAERGLYAYDLATGLAYLHSKNYLHRDIACRNCLLDRGRRLVKLSDFGLSRQADSVKLAGDEKIPIRWLAPEVVRTMVYTRAADVYAYGILVWEIFSNAALPYGNHNNAEIKAGIMKESYRPQFPSNTPVEIVKAASDCWKGEPAARPPLTTIAERLKTYSIGGGKPLPEDLPDSEDDNEKGANSSKKKGRGKTDPSKYQSRSGEAGRDKKKKTEKTDKGSASAKQNRTVKPKPPSDRTVHPKPPPSDASKKKKRTKT